MILKKYDFFSVKIQYLNENYEAALVMLAMNTYTEINMLSQKTTLENPFLQS